jgi:hypothetical protein
MNPIPTAPDDALTRADASRARTAELMAEGNRLRQQAELLKAAGASMLALIVASLELAQKVAEDDNARR